ncbi:LLM class F420-dependent oxidoreductase [Pseudonocardia sp. CNS-004]|nr:LLM class F420-dependent oxidoreductase [Pseudonocardia sp. CNS-004]
MKFVHSPSLIDARHQIPLALAAEAAGYDAVSVTDTVIYPRESDTDYPYTSTGDRSFIDDKDCVETMVQAAQLLAVTRTLRVAPYVLKLPVRPPVLVAKQAGSLAAVSGNRLDLGVGLSPWPEDFDALDVPWAARGKRMDECMDIVRGLTDPDGEEFFSYSGKFYDLAAVKQTPRPTAPLPLIVGGHADASMRRAARRGDGWMHGSGTVEQLDELLPRLARIRSEEGDTRDDFSIWVAVPDAMTLDGVRRLEDRGVTHCVVAFVDPYTTTGPDRVPLDDKLKALETYAKQVISAYR